MLNDFGPHFRKCAFEDKKNGWVNKAIKIPNHEFSLVHEFNFFFFLTEHPDCRAESTPRGKQDRVTPLIPRDHGARKKIKRRSKKTLPHFSHGKKKMPRNIIQNLSLVTWLIITLRIIIAIFRINRINKNNLQNQKYRLEEIVENPVNIVDHLDKLRKENWDLLQIKQQMNKLIEKIERRVSEKEKYFEQTLLNKKRKSNRN